MSKIQYQYFVNYCEIIFDLATLRILMIIAAGYKDKTEVG